MRPGDPETGAPTLHLLSNGRYAVLLSAAGGGCSALDGYALTRWAPDATRDADGSFLYLRDLDGGACWSAGYQPVQREPTRYEVSVADGVARLVREDDGVETRTEVCVAADADVEVRRYTFTNRGTKPRRLELTTYAEVVLNTPAADAAHPAFSKLFVQTAYLPERQALVAWRRLRSPDDRPLWLAHRLLAGPGVSSAEPEFETDRARFLGRGRDPARPRAMDADARLSGTVGNVLDPVFSLRRTIEIGPGETAAVTALLAAGRTRGEVERLLDRYDDAEAVERAFGAATSAPAGAERALGLPPGWLRSVRISAGDGEAIASSESGIVAHATGGHHSPAPSPRGAGSRRVGQGGAEARYERGGGEGPPAMHDQFRKDDPSDPEPLRLFNGFGGFSADGSEYVVRLRPGPHGLAWPPLPWVNVVANEEVGFLASESGAGYTWSANSRENRLTPWHNDPVSDPHGEALYIRDEESGVFWSPMPGPVPGAGAYEVRHGFGYSRYLHSGNELDQDVTLFVPRRDPVRVVRLRVTNRGERRRRLSLLSYAHLVLGGVPWETVGQVVTEHDPRWEAVLARNPERGEFSERIAFAAAVPPSRDAEVHFTTDRRAFLGRYGSVSHPAALRDPGPLDGRTGEVPDPCVAFQVGLEVGPGETAEVAFLLGEAATMESAHAVLGRHRDVDSIERALQEVTAAWRHLLSAVHVETPSPAIDYMVNGWLQYQNLSCRVWGRSAFYQSGGAFGFRDQLQDSSALLYLHPGFTRRQILLHAENQFVEGDVMHWWHPPLGKGIRTRFSDDLLWLPYVTAFYLDRTGDRSVLDEEARFLTARPLEPGEDEVFLVPDDSGESGSVYEHCCRALDRSLTRGPHGLPLMGVGDWNDGMNRVGREGRGESVWLGFFLYGILDEWIPICEQRGDGGRAERYREYRAQLHGVLNAEGVGWDGAWYRRAYYDSGAPLGSAENDECRIDTIAQAWAVLSRAAPAERAARALDAMEEHLVSEREGLIRLLTPAFDRTPHNPGYIKGYLPGVRENGGQYTHAALWAVRALAEFGRNDRAAALLEMLSPVSHTATPEQVAVYQAEPYVIAADVYGVEPHVGRGGWTWYTGSAGWMYRVALESILGLGCRQGNELSLRPCIPDAWPGYRLRYRLPDVETAYEIVVERAGAGRATEAKMDGARLDVEDGAVLIPFRRDGRLHRVEVALGSDVGPRYVAREEARNG